LIIAKNKKSTIMKITLLVKTGLMVFYIFKLYVELA